MERRASRFVAAARAAWDGGRADEATALIQAANVGTDVGTDAELRHVQGQIGLSCGIPFEGATVLIDGAQAVAQVDPQKAFRMLLDAAMCANYAGDPNLLMQAAKMAGELPIRETEPEAPVVELLGGLASMLEGKDAELHARLVQSLDRVDSVTEPLWLIFACVVAESIGDEAREEVFRRRAEAIARTSMAVGTLATVLERIAATDMNHGQVAAASLHSGEGLQFALDAGLTNSACFHRVVLAWAAAVRGDQEACISLAEEVAVTALKHGLPLNKLVADWAVGLLQLGLGRWEEAVTRLEGMSAAGPGADPPLIALRFVADLVEAAVRADRSDIAEWAATWLAEHAGEGAPDWQLALAARCRALVDPSIEAREALLSEALVLHAHDRRPFDRARTLLLLGELLRRQRRRKEARIPLRTALDAFEQLGASPWSERARRELRATGQTVRRRDVASSQELTVQERQVAAIVAEGATNREAAALLFLSPRTVEYHLRSLFTKLGISSRTELIRLQLDEAPSEPALG